MENDKSRRFFYESENSTRREAMLMNKLLFDLQLAYAMQGGYLKAYRTDVDDNGYDLVLDSEDISRKVQVKSTMVDTSTKSWSIAKGVLRAELHQLRKHSMWSNLSAGIGGGVILQEVTLNYDDITVNYYYTDLVILSLYCFGIIGNNNNYNSSRRVIGELHYDGFHDKVKLSRSCFIEMKSPAALLELMGFTQSRMYGNLIDKLHCLNNPETCSGPKEYYKRKMTELIDKVRSS
ncbi:hypothetical protein [Vibrio sp. OPT18]|uniref:hypothetical protein n=1 Tax=Vibrio sp. OPT18 TaxID=2778641 RepID=UPI00187F9D4D|nr:hypothetical protein [Vibrio sp. OPT18]MBE8577467.1 hypothetical protein [Vibrio sp. OPT18]